MAYNSISPLLGIFITAAVCPPSISGCLRVDRLVFYPVTAGNAAGDR